MRWFAAGAILAAFASLNYLFFPSLYSDWVYTGDFLRLGFYLLVLVGTGREIQTYWRRLADVAVLEERRRIARDLHDGLAQELAFIAAETRGPASKAAERALDESRRAIAALTRPVDEPLHVALVQAAEEVAHRVGTQIRFEGETVSTVPGDTREALIRIVREAVTNAARHGGAAARSARAPKRERAAASDRRRRQRLRAGASRGRAASGSCPCASAQRHSEEASGSSPRPAPARRSRWSPVSAPIRVLIADDHAPTRAGVREVLEGDGFAVCAEVASGPAAVEAARAEQPDVCLLDIRMPGGGIAAASEIAEELPDAAIVMLTVSRDDADLFDALRAGARGYLLKDVDRAELPAALRGALAGEAPLPANLVARLIEEFRERGRRKRLAPEGEPGRPATQPGVGGARAPARGPVHGRDRPAALHRRGDGAHARLVDPPEAARSRPAKPPFSCSTSVDEVQRASTIGRAAPGRY